jgi:hypothetical protein
MRKNSRRAMSPGVQCHVRNDGLGNLSVLTDKTILHIVSRLAESDQVQCVAF